MFQQTGVTQKHTGFTTSSKRPEPQHVRSENLYSLCLRLPHMSCNAVYLLSPRPSQPPNTHPEHFSASTRCCRVEIPGKISGAGIENRKMVNWWKSGLFKLQHKLMNIIMRAM
jgi:hypothetical protein